MRSMAKAKRTASIGEAPIGYLRLAWSYLRAAEVVALAQAESAVTLQHSSSPIAFLVGQAIELFLKSFLRHKGYIASNLSSNKFGHKLEVLLSECRSNGFGLNFSSNEDENFKRLAEMHSGKNFESRYLKTGSGTDIDLSVIFGLARGIMDLLEHQIDQARVGQLGLTTAREAPPMLPVRSKGLTVEEAAAQMPDFS